MVADERDHLPVMPVKPGRIPCCVLGCRRTAPASKHPPGTIIICGKCWQLASKHLRRRICRVERIGRRRGIDWATVDWESARDGEHRAVLHLHSKLFDEIVRSATDAKVGIG